MPDPLRVLLHEPDRDVRALVARALTGAGYAAVDSADWDGGTVDAVVVEPAAADAARFVERARAGGELPVLCISIYPPELALGVGEANAHLVKPFRAADVVEALDRLAYDGGR